MSKYSNTVYNVIVIMWCVCEFTELMDILASNELMMACNRLIWSNNLALVVMPFIDTSTWHVMAKYDFPMHPIPDLSQASLCFMAYLL
jgi:hypothetical protein